MDKQEIIDSLPEKLQELINQGWDKNILHRAIDDERLELKKQRAIIKIKEAELCALRALKEFEIYCEENGIMLDKNGQPRAHNIIEAAKAGKIIITEEDFLDIPHDDIELLVNKAQKFLVQTDFAALISDETFNNADFRLPYQHCMFEFVINGRPMVNICFDIDGVKNCIALVKSNDYWWMVAKEGADVNYCNYMWMQIQSMCIAIEAEIVDKEIVTAPQRINESRERKGKQKISDYHVVTLAKRFYARSSSNSGESLYRQRLHFRRGHWRHYDDTKIWIKWCLAGDPSLGFINKHYRA